MYYEYWGLRKPAFDNVPDPSMYVDCHASMENAIAETLFAIEEGDECIAVIVGDVGLGKTMSIRMIIDSLDQGKYKIALITNPGISFVQLLQEIIGQLTGDQCNEKRKVNLLELFNGLLFSTFEEGKKILIFIDEANVITPPNLEHLRLLTNMQGDKRNLFTMVLAGQIEFARRLEHPKRANLFQRVGTYSRIDKLESAEKVKKYVETRLLLAGTTRKIFTDDAFEKLWEQSNHGVPRLVNKLSKLCLKAGETNNFESIGGAIVDQIGSRFHKLAGPVIQKRRSRVQAGDGALSVPSAAIETIDEDTVVDGIIAAVEPSPVAAVIENVLAAPPDAFPEERRIPEEVFLDHAAMESIPSVQKEKLHELSTPESLDSEVEMAIGDATIKIQFPEHLIKQSLSTTKEHRCKLAGGLAAETLKKHPYLLASHTADPVPIWEEIRDFVLDRFDCARATQPSA